MVYFYSYYYSHENKYGMKKSVLFIVTEQIGYNSNVLRLHYYPVMGINNDPNLSSFANLIYIYIPIMCNSYN